MNEKLLRLLVEADNPDSFEFPENFSWVPLLNDVKSLQNDIESIVGESVELDTSYEDASYLGGYAIYRETDKRSTHYGTLSGVGPKIRCVVFGLLFSNFGRFFSIDWAEGGPCDEAKQLALIQLLENNNFHFVPGDLLDIPYTGSFIGPERDGMPWIPATWRHRYSDFW